MSPKSSLSILRSRTGLSVIAISLLAATLGCNQTNGDATPAVSAPSPEQFSQQMNAYLDTEAGRESVAKSVERYFKDAQTRAQQDAEQKAKDEIETAIKNPIDVPVGNSPVRGPATAKITIFEFSDFECPYCSKGAATAEQVLKAYPNDVKLVFKNLPLAFHANARPAAKAALAAGKQGKFWEFHDALFGNQRGLNEALYAKIAKDLGLNIAKFDKDRASEEIEAQVKEDEQIAAKLGFNGTPGFVVGGVPVRGAYPFDHFKSIIEKVLPK